MNKIILFIPLALAVGCSKPSSKADDDAPAPATTQADQKRPVEAVKKADPKNTDPLVEKPAPKKDDVVVESKNPYTEFLDNEAVAEARFTGKSLKASGMVTGIRKAKDGNGWVVFMPGYGNAASGDDRGYYCRFKSADDLAPLKVNLSGATIQGKFHHWNGSHKGLYLDDCKLIQVTEPNIGFNGVKIVWEAKDN